MRGTGAAGIIGLVLAVVGLLVLGWAWLWNSVPLEEGTGPNIGAGVLGSLGFVLVVGGAATLIGWTVAVVVRRARA